MDKTSRWRLMDAVNLICEEIAFASHCQELINAYHIDLQWWDETVIEKMIQQKDLLMISVDNRRNTMKYIYDKFQWDHHSWCSLKHAIGAYQYTTECLYANPDDGFWLAMQQSNYQKMVWVLSIFCWVDEFITCSRCLEDKLFTIKEDDDGSD